MFEEMIIMAIKLPKAQKYWKMIFGKPAQYSRMWGFRGSLPNIQECGVLGGFEDFRGEKEQFE